MKTTRSDKHICVNEFKNSVVKRALGQLSLNPNPKPNPKQRAVFVWDICPDTHEIIVVYDKE